MTALSLAPIGHHWPRSRVIAFYREVAKMPLATVYLGETVCGKRGSMRLKDWAAVATELGEAGRSVVLSTAPAIESAAELRLIERIASRGTLVEVNDAGVLEALAGAPFVAGPHLNAFNPSAVAALAGLGARRWIAPHELDRHAFAATMDALGSGVESELLVFGRLPLAFATQCHTARSYGRTRRDCMHCCLEHPEGQRLETLDGRSLMVVNGRQLLSQSVYNLMGAVGALRRMNVSLLRIDPPSAAHAGAVVEVFDAVLRGMLPEGEALKALASISPASFCNGYWLGQPGCVYAAPLPSGEWEVPSAAREGIRVRLAPRL